MARPPLQTLALVYQFALTVLFAAFPAVGVVYLGLWGTPDQLFMIHHFHEAAIGLSACLSLFLAFIAYRCHRATGERLPGFLALAYLGFGVVYAPHGVMTFMADHHPAAFLLWGPAARLVMGLALLMAIFPRDTLTDGYHLPWRAYLAGLAAVILLVGWLVSARPEWFPVLRFDIEAAALGVGLLSMGIMVGRRLRGPLLWFLGTAQAWFIISSAAFLIAKPWNALWWYAHAVGAAGFLLLGGGMVHVFRTSQSFRGFYSPEQMFALLSNAERMAAELKRAKEAAEQAIRSKLAFIAAANHDLRQPAQSLSLFLELLQARLKSGDPPEVVVEQLVRSNLALQHILEELLDLSRMDADQITLDPVDFPLQGLFDELADECRIRIGDKPLRIIVPQGGCRVTADRPLLRRVVGNLMDNAVKFSSQGDILVTAQQRGDRIRISVEDNGRGIAADQQEVIFDEFVQVGNQSRDRSQGLGLGLAVVRRLTALMGGSNGVVSSEGKGARFWIDLPAQQGAAPKTPQIQTRTAV